MTEQICELCENTKAVMKCISCKIGQNLCPDCYKATHYGDNKRVHQVQLFQEKETMSSYSEILSKLSLQLNCPLHTNKAIEYICKQCDTIICCDCLLIGEHKGHSAISFIEACKEIKKKYDTALTFEISQSETLKEKNENISKKVNERQEKYRNWANSITSTFKSISEKLEAKKIEILQDLEEIKQKEFIEYEKLFGEIKALQEQNKLKQAKLENGSKQAITPQTYKEAKQGTPSAFQEYQINVDKYFESNKEIKINAEKVIKGIDSIFSSSTGPSPKKEVRPKTAIKQEEEK